MALRHVSGLDHVVILVRDLGSAAAGWTALGFTLSPRGTHSPHKGTGNHTIMLGPDYVELLGILHHTELNATDRGRLAEIGEGVDRAALRTDDAASGLDEIRRLGFDGSGPQAFARPVDLPGGGVAEAAFRTFEWPPDRSPAGLRLFACQHLTPEHVWVPALTSHANTAARILRLECLSVDPAADAREMAALIGGEPERIEGGWRVATGGGRAAITFADRAEFARRYPDIDAGSLRTRGAAALVLAVASLETARRAVPDAMRLEQGIAVKPAVANGVLLVFEEA